LKVSCHTSIRNIILTEVTDIGGKYHLEYASTILFCISVPLVVAVYIIYWKGPVLRKRSPFAQQLEDARNQLHVQVESRRGSKVPHASRANSYARSQQDLRIRPTLGSRANSRVNSQANSRVNSRANSRRNSVANA
jgi:hypothetical protein